MADRSVSVRSDKSAATLSSGSVSGTALLCERYTEATVFLWVSAVSGTNPTLDVAIRTGPDDGTSSPSLMATHTSMTQQTGVTTLAVATRVTNVAKYLQLYYTVGGTSTPTVTCTTKIVFKT